MSRVLGFSVVLGGLSLLSVGGCMLIGDFGSKARPEIRGSGGAGGSGSGGGSVGGAGGTGGTDSGAPVWSRRYGDEAHQRAKAAAITSDGHIVLGGEFAGKLDMGAGHSHAVSSMELKGFAARLDEQGASLWLENLTDAPTVVGNVSAVAAGMGSAGEVIFAGGQQHLAAGAVGSLDANVWMLNGDGTPAWSKPYVVVSDADDNVQAIATNVAADAAYVALSLGKGASLPNCGTGEGDVPLADDAKGAVVKVGGVGGPNCEWGFEFGGTKLAPVGIAVDSTGRTYTAIRFAESFTAAGPVAFATPSINDYATVLVSFGDPPITPIAARKYAGSNIGESVTALAMAMDESMGVIYIVGSVKGTFEDKITTMAGDTDALVLAVGLDGSVIWAKRIGGTATQYATSVALAPAGGVYVSGITTGPMANATQSDVDALCLMGSKCGFLMRLDSSGNTISARAFGNVEPASDAALVLAANKDQLVIVGGWSEPLDFGNGVLQSAGMTPNQDVVVAKFAPPP